MSDLSKITHFFIALFCFSCYTKLITLFKLIYYYEYTKKNKI